MKNIEIFPTLLSIEILRALFNVLVNINTLKTYEGMMPIAEKVYKQIITLPLFPLMTNKDVDDVIQSIKKVINYYKIKHF